MAMTVDSITALIPLKERANENQLHDLSIYVPEDEDIDFESDSYIFVTRSRPHWRQLLDFTSFAERLLQGRVFVVQENEMDSPQITKALTGAIPIV